MSWPDGISAGHRDVLDRAAAIVGGFSEDMAGYEATDALADDMSLDILKSDIPTGTSRWGVHKLSALATEEGWMIGLAWEDPATEMQEDMPPDYRVVAIRPVTSYEEIR